MLRGITICPDSELCDQLDRAMREVGHVSILRTVDHYPDAVELNRIVRASAPGVIFLGTEAVGRLSEVVEHAKTASPALQIVAVARKFAPELLLEAMRAGIREFLAYPFPANELREAVHRVNDLLAKSPVAFESSELVYSFLPSKAGVGATTIAMNLSVAMASVPNTRVVLSDFDLNSGMLRFMMKLQDGYSVIDAVEHAFDMDENLWPQLVTSFKNLDILHAGRLNPNVRIEGTQIRNLIQFMRRNYSAICLDLSGNLEKYSLEIMHESKKIFLVCTPEIPSLHLAREKFAFLKGLDLDSRVAVLVNRCTKRAQITPEQIEHILGLPVMMTLPNDYVGVHRAVTEAKPIDAKSELGRHFARLANQLLEKPAAPSSDGQKKSFIEFFSIAPPRKQQKTAS